MDIEGCCPYCGSELVESYTSTNGVSSQYCRWCHLHFTLYYNDDLEPEYWTYQSTRNRRTSDDAWDYVEPPNRKGRIPGGRFTRDG